MMGFYPNCPGDPTYILTAPVFDRVTIKLQPGYYKRDSLVIEAPGATGSAAYVKEVTLGGRKVGGSIVRHEDLVNAGVMKFVFNK